MDQQPFEISSPWTHMSAALSRRVERATIGRGNITVTQYRMLLAISSARSRARVTRIADILDLQPSAVTNAADGLESQRLITRREDSADRRIVLLEITDIGRERLLVVDDALQSLINEIWSPLSSEQRARCLAHSSVGTRVFGEVREDAGVIRGDTAYITCLLRTFHGASKAARWSSGLSFCQFRILYELLQFPEGVRVGELADTLYLRHSDVTIAADELAARHLIVRSRDRVDRRAVRLEITSEGATTLEIAYRAVCAAYAEGIPSITPEQNSDLLEIAAAVVSGF